jgi:two-component system, NtrC family, sensor histidine kinase PilS
MLGRLLVAIVLLGGMLLLLGTTQVRSEAFTPLFLQVLIAATFAASLAFALLLPRVHRLDRFAAVQLGWDLLTATGLVFVSGGAASGFTFLYGVVVLMAAIVLGTRAVIGSAAAALALYSTTGIGLANGWLPHPPDQLEMHYRLATSELGTAVLTNVMGLLLVGLLAGNLAVRLKKAGGQLERAERSARSLERLNDHIVRSIASGVITTRSDGTVQAVNPAAADMFRASPTALLGRPLPELMPGAWDEAAGADPARLPAVDRGEDTAVRPDGSTFPVGYSRRPLVADHGEAIGHLVAFQDLTEIRALRATAEQAERLAVLGRLAAGLAHEIRNPLSSISGSVQMVRHDAQLGPEDSRLLDIVLSEAERLNELVSTMLQVGRPRPPQREQVDLGALAAEVVDMARRGPAASPAVTLELERPPSGPMAQGDADQLRQVVWNLLKNAIQASSTGGVVRVCVGSEGTHSAIEVRDRGQGIDPEQMGHLFEMFYSGRQGGVGLGLALVKQIVDAHGGTIHVDSSPDEGTRFRVVLPA